MSASDSSLDASYGDFINAPRAMIEGFEAVMSGNPDQDPQRVADAIVSLVGTPTSERPFRTVVDGMGIADAMFAPVCVRFRGYGVPMDATVQAYVDAIYALPAMREWVAAALAETERVGADEA